MNKQKPYVAVLAHSPNVFEQIKCWLADSFDVIFVRIQQGFEIELRQKNPLAVILTETQGKGGLIRVLEQLKAELPAANFIYYGGKEEDLLRAIKLGARVIKPDWLSKKAILEAMQPRQPGPADGAKVGWNEICGVVMLRIKTKSGRELVCLIQGNDKKERQKKAIRIINFFLDSGQARDTEELARGIPGVRVL